MPCLPAKFPTDCCAVPRFPAAAPYSAREQSTAGRLSLLSDLQPSNTACSSRAPLAHLQPLYASATFYVFPYFQFHLVKEMQMSRSERGQDIVLKVDSCQQQLSHRATSSGLHPRPPQRSNVGPPLFLAHPPHVKLTIAELCPWTEQLGTGRHKVPSPLTAAELSLHSGTT